MIIQQSQFEFFKKPCGVFPPQSEMGEKPRGGNQDIERKKNYVRGGIKPYQSFSAIITIKQTCFLNKF